ncbi:Ribonuclease H2 subunit A [Cytospora mali]|uniref:Ribonuclease n=1 Tax=Cytospora mali TaxID=578113 RepID=A0A194V9C5_CYTMA|nr:Ribonuclease H2 subunit A [Valsa mali var. pyri (nom. inval.)]
MADPDTALETPAPDVFIPPSVHPTPLLAGDSYTHFSPAGRGPVLGPMVYGVFYLPLELSDPLLRGAHHFDDSKVLTPAVRSDLMEKLCTPVPAPAEDNKNNNNYNNYKNEPDKLHSHCGWATTALSARDISANMLKPSAAYNLNMQAMDATIALIQGVLARGVNVRDIYVDTIGQPAAYQKKLERVFPSVRITVAKKADSLYPCVSAASVCAKVTRDAALEVLHSRHVLRVDGQGEREKEESAGMAWGSGYPSDPRCVSWMKGNMHPVFGWGPECRFSWGTAKDMIEGKGSGVKVEWPVEEDGDTARLTDFFSANGEQEKDADELGTWFGTPAGLEAF